MPGGVGTGPMRGRGSRFYGGLISGSPRSQEMLLDPHTRRIRRSYTVSSPSVGSPASVFGERVSSG